MIKECWNFKKCFFFNKMNLGDVTVAQINDVVIDDLVLKTCSPGQMIEGTKFIKNSVEFHVSRI